MDLERSEDAALAARLKRLDAASVPPAPGFDYDGLLERQARGQARARRRVALARGGALALVLVLVGASAWRLGQQETPDEAGMPRETVAMPAGAFPEAPSLIRADSHLALVALEDHIASLDEALNVARLRGGSADVARLERTRAELVASYSQLRYAELVSANF